MRWTFFKAAADRRATSSKPLRACSGRLENPVRAAEFWRWPTLLWRVVAVFAEALLRSPDTRSGAPLDFGSGEHAPLHPYPGALLARRSGGRFAVVTAVEVIAEIERLPADEQAEVVAFAQHLGERAKLSFAQ